MATQTKDPAGTKLSVSRFAMEAEHPTNSDLLIRSLSNCRLRSAIRPIKEVFGREEGEDVTKAASAGVIDGVPGNVPGMQLHVDPSTRRVRVVDPLEKDEDTLERINKALKRSGVSTGTKLRAVPLREEVLGEDEFKSLVREMVYFIEAGEAKVAKGVKPDLEDVDLLPGDYLTNPGSLSQWNMPRYEKDVPEWKQRLNRLGA